ncbi:MULTISPECIES: tol-pal system protein YbgF [unclassified Methylocaldum]|jgi:tol-pal system protein YbgF|uniref:tol-pal system protein YbgF n=1 Tax=unclassified Methylocaldum TaxID=2622260 RepID=UPI00143DFA32|nr:tol-pal system protein YbgF [Methylocaldum sp. RMAD-M]MBP1148734.1 tol-pal system protein YbgF [Methylocaldum sp. RMAD-M]
MHLKKPVFTLLFLGSLHATISSAQQYDQIYDRRYDQNQTGYGVATLEERVSQLEKRLSGNTLIEMFNRMEQLQAEVLKLRGENEELAHQLEELKNQQQAMYTDLDQRMQQLSAGGSAAPQAPLDQSASPDGAAPTEATASQAPAPQAPVSPGDPGNRQAAYQKAFNTLKEGKYPEAVKEFKNFIAAYPTGEYADNAHYWLAEAYYVSRDFNTSRDIFRKLIKDFPQSSKVPDALLKIGFIEYETGQKANAKELLTEVVKRYPDSSAAKMAEKRLDKLRQEAKR